MCIECFDSLLGFVSLALENEEQALVIIELTIVVQLVFGDVFLKLFEFFFLILIMFDLPEVEETCSLLTIFSLLLLLCIILSVLVGKNRQAFQCTAKAPYLSSTAYISKFNIIHSLTHHTQFNHLQAQGENKKMCCKNETYIKYILIIRERSMEANGINYYKGVLLCSRPNQSPSTNLSRQFCGRVHPHQQLGLVPVKQFDERKTRKRVLPVLNNHKKWLDSFKKSIHEQKQQEEKEKEKVAQRLQKIKQEGYQQRQKLKNTSQAKPQQSQPVKLPQIQPHKKKEKPAWAKTAQEVEENAEKEVDQLIDFFNTEEKTELKDYVSDDQVKNLLVQLKTKIEKLKEQQDWKTNQLKKLQQNRVKAQEEREKLKDKDDILSRISKNSGAQSVASQKTAERVEQLERKKKDAEWQKMTATQKKTMASVDEQIAKNIADQVLRNYPSLKHHSNQSIRQLIQKHAHQQVKS